MKKKYYNLTVMRVEDDRCRYINNLAYDNMGAILRELIKREWYLFNAQELTKTEFEFLHRQVHFLKTGGDPN